jgi:hypothetical protein
MDDLGPRIRQSTKLSQLERKRYDLEWVLRLEPGLETHVTLFDLQTHPPEAVAVGHGADEAEALLDLWTILNGRDESADAITVVADAYKRRTGRAPE